MSSSSNTPPTTLLIVLDGWGYREAIEHNAIAAAATPTWDRLWQNAPHTLISGTGVDVGLPPGQMGNSEVGHMNLGSGRVVYQDFSRITHAIEQGDFQRNPVLAQALENARWEGGRLHLLGLLSAGGVHSHEDQFLAMIRMAYEAGVEEIYVHAFLDGRDTPPRSAQASLQRIEACLQELEAGHIASIVGRYFAMDRDQRWDRIERAYDLLTLGQCEFAAASPQKALAAAYARGENDEFVQATAIHAEGASPIVIRDNDAVVFMNFRADRARQLTRAFVDDVFQEFQRRQRPRLSDFVMLTHYADDLNAHCAFEPLALKNTLGEYLSDLGKTQLHIAETEKYAHVTFFFNGGREQPFVGETRKLIPSPKVATYDLQPQMSASQVTDELVQAITQRSFDFIVCNFANGDMVGHTGIFDAAVTAVETIDDCLQRITEALSKSGSQCLITADHGNIECLFDASTGQPYTAHTLEPVPLIYVGPAAIQLDSGGVLSDVAPTLLALMSLPKPREMSGHSLILAADTAGSSDSRGAILQ